MHKHTHLVPIQRLWNERPVTECPFLCARFRDVHACMPTLIHLSLYRCLPFCSHWRKTTLPTACFPQGPSPDMKWTSDNSGMLGRGGSEVVASGSRSAIAAGASTLPTAGFSSTAGSHYRVPTPTEQTPSPRKGMPNSGGGVFAFGADSPDSIGHDKRDDHEYFGANGGGLTSATCGGGNLGTGYEQGQGAISPAARGWRSEDAGGGESGDEVEGGGVDAGFREELDVFASSLRKEFELKVCVCVSLFLGSWGGSRCCFFVV